MSDDPVGKARGPAVESVQAADAVAAQAAAHAAADRHEQMRLQDASLRERGEMILAACRAAWSIHRSRLAAGFPPAEPAPWPQSTLELLRRYAAHARGQADG